MSRKTQSGLTLTELLIALAITALVLGVTVEGASRALDFQNRLQASRELRDSVSGGMAALRSRLRQSVAVARPNAAPDGEEDAPVEVLFQGDAQGFSFIAADPGYPSQAGLYEYRVRIASEGDEEGVTLQLARRPFIDPARFAADEADFQSWTLAVFDRAPQLEYGAETDWRSDWHIGENHPSAVRVTLPGLAVPLMVQSLAALAPPVENEDEDGEEEGPDDETLDGEGRGDGDRDARPRRRGNGLDNGRDT